MVDQPMKTIAIIGGGITGLASAYFLQKKLKQKGLPYEVMLIEATPRLGGKIKTTMRDGFIIERGPESFPAQNSPVVRLAKEVGLEEELVSMESGSLSVVVRDTLYPLPSGTLIGIPMQLFSFLRTKSISLFGKIRAVADLILPRSKERNDQSFGGFIRRRMGDEVFENLTEPVLSNSFGGDLDGLSLMSTFPEFYETEQKHRSLIMGLKKYTAAKRGSSTGRERQTFKNGMESFISAIEGKLDPETILKGVRVQEIDKVNDEYVIQLNNNCTVHAASIIVATPHQASYNMFASYPFFEILKEMSAISVATISLAFDADAFHAEIVGSGFVVSRNSDYTVTCCTYTHMNWPHMTPAGKVLIRCYIGRSGDETVVDLSDQEIIRIVMDDLNKTLSITKDPNFSVISRWKKTMPQYTVGHKQKVEQLKNSLEIELPGIYLAGSSYDGFSLPDCIVQSEKVVKKVWNFLQLDEDPLVKTVSVH